MVLDRRTQYHKDITFPKVVYKSNTISVKNIIRFFSGPGQTATKIQKYLEKGHKGETALSNIKTYYKVPIIFKQYTMMLYTDA